MRAHAPGLLRVLFAAGVLGSACADDDGGNAADRAGVGAACSSTAPCPKASRNGAEVELACLTAFRGGYCGIRNCQADGDCPDGAACVNHEDGSRYCFRLCVEKDECNLRRSEDEEANCSSNVDFAQASMNSKACVPPSSGL
jgi:hypothetical protein